MSFQINNKLIGPNYPTYFIAELSCNHHGNLDEALELVRLAKESGADAVKMQHYTGDGITFKSDKEWFQLKNTSWDDKKTLWELFDMAHTPWEWTQSIKDETEKLGMDFFSSPFDITAVDFLESFDIPCYKIASMEIIDIPIIKKVAEKHKPVIVSTGMATLSEIEECLTVLRNNGAGPIALLKCTSQYPALPKDANLKTIQNLAETFNCVVGLSDHTEGTAVAITAVALGARIIEKHFIKDRSIGGPDSAFSLEPAEFKQMVDAVRIAEVAIGKVHYGGVKGEVRIFRRSLFVVKDMKQGDEFIENVNVRSIRPGDGLHSRYLSDIVGKKASRDIEAGAPLLWDLVN